jgi:hypothetical protein
MRQMARTASDIIEIGRDLIAVKGTVGHSNFLAWIDAEFRMSAEAGRFMNIASRLADQIPHDADFTPTVLYLLAAPCTLDEIVDDVTEPAAQGNKTAMGQQLPRPAFTSLELDKLSGFCRARRASSNSAYRLMCAYLRRVEAPEGEWAGGVQRRAGQLPIGKAIARTPASAAPTGSLL